MTHTNGNCDERNNCCCVPATRTEGPGVAKEAQVTFSPPMDFYEFADRYEMWLDVPGAGPEDIEITLNDGVLSIEARVAGRIGEGAQRLHTEYAVGDYRRQVRLGEDIDEAALGATCADGVLVLSLSKRARRQARRIEVSGGRAG